MTIDEKKMVINIAKDIMIPAMEKNSYLIACDAEGNDNRTRSKNIADNFKVIVDGVKRLTLQ